MLTRTPRSLVGQVRATRISLLRAVRTGGAGPLVPGAHALYVSGTRTSLGRAVGYFTDRTPWHLRLHHIAKPKAFGANWAYIFPLAALASASIAQADARGSLGARVLAWAALSLQCVVACLVVVKMILHQRRVMQGREVWVDPLVA